MTDEPSVGLQGPQEVNTDWFVSAIVHEGCLSDSLDAVSKQVERKLQFLSQLKQRLCQSGVDIDELTYLGRAVKELENTLRFRLGLLQADRHAAWFRQAHKFRSGAFSSPVLLAPIFFKYEAVDVEAVKVGITDCWRLGQVDPEMIKNEQVSLWSILLEFRQKLAGMAKLEGSFAGLTLDELPDGIPEDIDCRSMRAFLLNVKAEFKSVNERLTICYEQLWNASEKLWASQLQLVESLKKRDLDREKRRQRAYGSTNRRSRTENDGHISFKEMEALKYMGFRSKPENNDLRTRYLEMAKKLHPDREGGSEESFKMLTKAYHFLSERTS